MWQRKISFLKSLENTGNFIKKRISEISGAEVRITEKLNRIYVHIIIEDDYVKKGREKVLKIISDAILVYSKFDFILSKTRILTVTPPLCAFISSLIYFDSPYERAVLSNVLSSLNEFSIDGIINFRMQNILSNWQELAAMTNSLLATDYTDSDIFNVTSYMISVRQKEDNSVFVADMDGTLITDVTRGQLIDVNELYQNRAYNILNAIISACPSEVIIEKGKIDKELISTLKNIVKIKML